jgi:lipopolysaccharide/colanic/teichoic acid biosynthesis glycosyltransferase
MTPTVQPSRTVGSGRNGRSFRGDSNSHALLPEDQFIAAVSRERQRSERSKKPFVLMLAEIRELDSDKFRDALASKAIEVLRHSIRATDVVGWYRSDHALGVIFTELGNADKDLALATLKSRMSDVLHDNLGGVGSAAIKLRFHWFPEDPVPPGGSLDLSVYPECQRQTPPKKVALSVKRVMDLLASALALVFLSWLLFAIVLLIKATSKGPALFRQKRIGQHGKPFTFLKFRSMHVGNDATIHREYVARLIAGKKDSPGQGKQEIFKITNDPRITPIGRILRKTSLDELPQLINVLKGEMSLIGPRPPVPYEFECYDLWHRRRVLEVKPGITGLWQVKGRSRTSFDDMVRLDLHYTRNWSLWLDLKILLDTPRAVFSGDGAY